jgi:hypothetical protein
MTGIGRMLLAAVLATASAAPAMDADDVVRLTKAKVGDAVIVAQIGASGARFAPSADELIRLKKEGVADAVLKAMIESGARRPAEPAAARTEPPPAGRAGEDGTLILENLTAATTRCRLTPSAATSSTTGARRPRAASCFRGAPRRSTGCRPAATALPGWEAPRA